MGNRLRVGVIGIGAIATDEVHGHIPNYLQIPEVELVAISDVNGRRAQYIADRMGIPQVYTHFRDMLSHANLDAVSICTPSYLHAAIAIGCLQQGVHVLVEKPMALTSEGGRRMIEAAEGSGKHLFVGMNNRFRDDTRAIKLMVSNGALGRVYSVKANWLRRRHSSEVTNWFTSKAQAGGGPLWDIGLVMLDLALWMMSFPQPVAVSGVLFEGIMPDSRAAMGTALLNPDTPSPYPVEDAATALVRFDNGSALSLEVSWASMVGETDEILLRLDGTSGSAELRNPDSGIPDSLRIHGELFGTRMELAPKIPPSNVSSHRRELQHFVDVCLGRETPLVTPQQALLGVQIVEAIYRSATEQRFVRLDEPAAAPAQPEATESLSINGNGAHHESTESFDEMPVVA